MKSSFCKGKALFQCKLCLLCEIFTGGGRTAQCSSEDIDDFFGRIESFFSCFYKTVLEVVGCFLGLICLTTLKKLIMPGDFLCFSILFCKIGQRGVGKQGSFCLRKRLLKPYYEMIFFLEQQEIPVPSIEKKTAYTELFVGWCRGCHATY